MPALHELTVMATHQTNSLLRFVRTALAAITISVLLVIVILGILGGGWGEKPSLPDQWQSFDPPLLLAHRGMTDSLPENSMAALDRAVERGFDGLEVDLQYARDSVFILAHDQRGNRLLGLDTVITHYSSQELAALPLLHHSQPTDQIIPSLNDVVQRQPDRTLFYFDMKRHGHESKIRLADDIAAVFERHNLYDRGVVASAHIWFIAYLEYNYPRIVTVLEGINPRFPWLYSLIPARFRTDLIASRYATVTDDFAVWLRKSGMNHRYIAYHIEPSAIDSALTRGIRMFIIDHGENLKPYLERP